MADLLIRDASLPKDKEQIFVIFPDGVVNVVEKGTPVYKAVEIPEHGRCICAERLTETINYAIREAGWPPEYNAALRLCKGFIDEEKTVIPASGEEVV